MKRFVFFLLLVLLVGSLATEAVSYQDTTTRLKNSFLWFFNFNTGNAITGMQIAPPGGSGCDNDQDGYDRPGGGCGGDDCDDTNANIHPGHIEWCTTTYDNDCDGYGGCLDDECDGMDEGNFFCEYQVEITCGDTYDNDGDGLVDCADSDCTNDAACVTVVTCGDSVVDSPETCDDGNTVDGDGCSAVCVLEVCNDGIINNNEVCDGGTQTCVMADGSPGTADCNSACTGFGACVADPNGGAVETSCDDGIDDDNDGAVDCADSDCAGVDVDGYICCIDDSVCTFGTACDSLYDVCVESLCDDNIDNEQDGYTDCIDWDCSIDANCAAFYGTTELSCDDGIDNDKSGYTDCSDTACQSDLNCQTTDSYNGGSGYGNGAEICGNGIDDDNDGLIDTLDIDCATPVASGNSQVPQPYIAPPTQDQIASDTTFSPSERQAFEEDLLTIQETLNIILLKLDLLQEKQKVSAPLAANQARLLAIELEENILDPLHVFIADSETYDDVSYYDEAEKIHTAIKGFIARLKANF